MDRLVWRYMLQINGVHTRPRVFAPMTYRPFKKVDKFAFLTFPVPGGMYMCVSTRGLASLSALALCTAIKMTVQAQQNTVLQRNKNGGGVRTRAHSRAPSGAWCAPQAHSASFLVSYSSHAHLSQSHVPRSAKTAECSILRLAARLTMTVSVAASQQQHHLEVQSIAVGATT